MPPMPAAFRAVRALAGSRRRGLSRWGKRSFAELTWMAPNSEFAGRMQVRTVRIDARCPMKSIVDQLPPQIARQIHPERQKNEAAYWVVRDQLLDRYRGQWIGFADGKVIASGTSPVTVFHAAEATGLHPFFICVGREEEPCRIRRATFPYDAGYPGESLPVINVEFRRASGSPGVVIDRVIPDTGADASVLPGRIVNSFNWLRVWESNRHSSLISTMRFSQNTQHASSDG